MTAPENHSGEKLFAGSPPPRLGDGPIAWAIRNSVAANLIMIAMIIGGAFVLGGVRQEVFPEFQLDMVNVAVAYPGASPEEVERGVTVAIEEAVRAVDGVKEISSNTGEGVANITVELALGTNRDRALSDVKSAVDRVTSMPRDVERPMTALLQIRSQIIALVVYGDTSEKTLRALAEGIRDELLDDPGISTVELAGIRPLEISIQVRQEKLREYGLTLEQIAAAIRAANVEVPAGGIKTDKGEILLRTDARRDFGSEFHSIALVSRPDGTSVTLGDVATIEDGFRETDQEAYFNGKRAAMLRVYRVGEETPLAVAAAVKKYIENKRESLPEGVSIGIWDDRSRAFRERLDVLLSNTWQGLLLIMLCLGLFLDVRLAFWVTLGIPTAVFGSFIFLPGLDVSINMISLFAFIVTLGIMVDDAIVISEAVHKRREEGLSQVDAAIAGVRDVAVPVTFSVLSAVVAFTPLLFVPGVSGKFFRNIPIVVNVVLLVSLAEALFILPAHLAHANPIALAARRWLKSIFGEGLGPVGWLHRKQQRFSQAFERTIRTRFQPFARRLIRNRYPVAATALALLAVASGWIGGGRIDFTFFPKIESDVVFAQLTMPYGTPVTTSRRHLERMVSSLREVLAEHGGEQKNSLGIFSQVGAANFGGTGRSGQSASGSQLAEVALLMPPMDERAVSAKVLAAEWRTRIGDIPGAESVKLQYTSGASAESPIAVRLSHRDVRTLETASAELASRLRAYTGVKDVDDGVELGKVQLNFELSAEARSLGITETDLARQVRAAFFGAEASRQQRGRDEVRVYVRLPREQRTSLEHLETLMVRAPNGREIPLALAARMTEGRAYTGIRRVDGRRRLTVEADVEEGKANANKVMADLREGALPELAAHYPGLSWDVGGQQRSQAESLDALWRGFLLSMLANFVLLAIPLRSYFQPIVIMSVIPFSIVGALLGHIAMGYDLSILSIMGLTSLSGMVVNDSIVLIDAVNEFRKAGMSRYEAVVAACVRRFRAIMLVSVTTFLGLAPMIWESSFQARFLIPMGLSIAFGGLFSTITVWLVVPSFYLILQDVGDVARRMFGAEPPAESSAAPVE
ncbi:MAG: efflux RND transporter permease subunit [Myxococcales bacterium]|nr:efflux RND transporter permease subunit [Myxococcales bacterium]